MDEDDFDGLLTLSLSTGYNSYRTPPSNPNEPSSSNSSSPPPSSPSSSSINLDIAPSSMPTSYSLPFVSQSYPPFYQQQYSYHQFMVPTPPSLNSNPNPNTYPSPSQDPIPNQNSNPNSLSQENTTAGSSSSSKRIRRYCRRTVRQGQSETIPPPFPWATDRRAMVHRLDYLLAHNITTISGEVQCKRCDAKYEIEYDLREKFGEVATYIRENRDNMHNRAPAVWMNPNLPVCKSCKQNNCVKPASSKKRDINWLFLLLGQMLGCCRIAELKYFCKHTKNHRTGAKDRVLYYTYLDICKQLDPSGPFEI